MKKWDYIIIAFIAVLSIACFVYVQNTMTQTGNTVVIELNGQVVKRLSLNKDITFSIDLGNEEDGYNFIEIKDGYVKVTQSTCRDKICVNTSAISKVGQSIICLPHKLVIRIEGNAQGIDGVSG